MSKKKVVNMLLFTNGNIAAFDQEGRQIGELQANAVDVWSEWAKGRGYDIDGCKFATSSISGHPIEGVVVVNPGSSEVELKWISP